MLHTYKSILVNSKLDTLINALYCYSKIVHDPIASYLPQDHTRILLYDHTRWYKNKMYFLFAKILLVPNLIVGQDLFILFSILKDLT